MAEFDASKSWPLARARSSFAKPLEATNCILSKPIDVVIYEDDIKFCGLLRKQSIHMKMWKQRWCVLTSQYIATFKCAGDCSNPTELLTLSDVVSVRSAEQETRRQHTFCVITANRTFYLAATSVDEKEKWTAAIMDWLLPQLLLVHQGGLASGDRPIRRISLFSLEEQAFDIEHEASRQASAATDNSSFDGSASAEGEDDVADVTSVIVVSPVVSPRRKKTVAWDSACVPADDEPASPKSPTRVRRGSIKSLPDNYVPVRRGSIKSMPENFHGENCLLDIVGPSIKISYDAVPALRSRTSSNPEDNLSLEDKQAALAKFEEHLENLLSLHQVGTDVFVRDSEDQVWRNGKVTCAKPLKVQCSGETRGRSYQYVEKRLTRRSKRRMTAPK